MKKTSKLMMAAVMMMATLNLVSCGDDDEKNNEGSNSNSYAFIYMGRTLEPAQIVYANPTDDEIRDNFAALEFFVENKTDAELNSKIKIEKLSGPAEMDDLMICYGEECTSTGSMPWKSENIVFTPGINQNMMIKIEYMPSVVTSTTKYRITVGKGGNLTDPQVMYLVMNAD